MAFFSNVNSGNSYLYLAQEMPGDTGWCAYVLPEGSSAGSEIDPAPAFNDLPGAYLFSFSSVTVSGDALVAAIWEYMAQKISPNRAIVWINQTPGTSDLQINALGFSLTPTRTGPNSKVFTVTNALTGPVSRHAGAPGAEQLRRQLRSGLGSDSHRWRYSFRRPHHV